MSFFGLISHGIGFIEETEIISNSESFIVAMHVIHLFGFNRSVYLYISTNEPARKTSKMNSVEKPS